MAGQADREQEDRREERFQRSERSAGEMVAQRLQDEMRSAVASIRSGPWPASPIASED